MSPSILGEEPGPTMHLEDLASSLLAIQHAHSTTDPQEEADLLHKLHGLLQATDASHLIPALLERRCLQAGDSRTVSALELLVSPAASTLLSHTSLIDAVEDLWTRRQDRTTTGFSTRALCVPRRIHALDFLFRVLFILLVLTMVILPGPLINDRPSEARVDDGSGRAWRPDGREIVFIIFSVGHLFQPRFLLSLSHILPSMALLTSLIPALISLSYPLLSASLLALLFSLITPSTPSMAHLLPSVLLPLSAYSITISHRLLKPSLLFLPLTLCIASALTISLNGDILRLGFAPSQQPPPIIIDPPEPGVAPFLGRVWLSLSLVATLLAWLIVSCSRLVVPSSPNTSRSRYSSPEDPWEAEWGWEAAVRARRERIRALLRYLAEGSEPTEFMISCGGEGAVSQGEERIWEREPLLGGRAPRRRGTTAGRGGEAIREYRSLPPVPLPLPSPLNLVPVVVGRLPAALLYYVPRSIISDRDRLKGLGWWWKASVDRAAWVVVAWAFGFAPVDVARRWFQARRESRVGAGGVLRL